jgi:hypothetical protein
MSRDPEPQASRSVITVTASANDPSNPASVLLVALPLVADLLPGASVTVDVPGIDAATGRTTNWLSINLSVLGDATWLAAYSPVGAWFSDAGLGTPGSIGSAAPAGPVTSASSATLAPASPSTPTPAPTVAPTPTPTPTAMPTPSAVPAAAATPARAPVTRSYSEHNGAITYRGSWGNAPFAGYLGGNVAWSSTPGATATLTFTGSAVSWLGPKGPTRGIALVLLDGRAVARIDLWRSSFVARAVLFQRSFAAVGPHTLTVKVLSMPSRPFVAIDGFAVTS